MSLAVECAERITWFSALTYVTYQETAHLTRTHCAILSLRIERLPVEEWHRAQQAGLSPEQALRNVMRGLLPDGSTL